MKRNAMSLAAIAALFSRDVKRMPTFNHGRSPKEYGQMLQFNRRQKWTKSKL
jgi:hypothetical protein